MKFSTRLYVFIIALLFNLNAFSQVTSLTKEYKGQAIQSLTKLMDDYYVFPEVAKLTGEHLKAQFEDGYFNQFDNDESFAVALTKSVQSINKDKHMRISVNRPFEAAPNSPEWMIEEHMDRMERSRRGNFGFNTVKILEGNVGYLDLRGFAGLENAKDFVEASMKLMSRTDAIIFDLSKNGGGSPAMVQYLCSYFFDQKIHLNSLYWREGNETQEFWTLDEVGGAKRPEVPLFVITSSRTFSAAEEFSYNLQAQKRAVLVGQITGGGANPGGGMSINDKLTVFIPRGKAINPITKTNWEGIGVIPNIKTAPEEAFDKTYELAKEAAELYRVKTKEKYSEMFFDLISKLNQDTSDNSEQIILQSLKQCQETNFFEEGDINILGYQYLMEHKRPKIAQSIFKANTILYPDSANVFDSYAEALMLSGDLKSSLINYQKAVDIAAKNDDDNLELFKKNLETVKSKLVDKK